MSEHYIGDVHIVRMQLGLNETKMVVVHAKVGIASRSSGGF